MTKFFKVTSTGCDRTPAIINIDHVVVIEPLRDGECTSLLLDSGSYYIADVPYDTIAELLDIQVVEICTDEETIKKARELHEQFKEVFGT